MRLNHLNLCVDDLDAASDFFRQIFDFRLLDRKGDALVILSDGDGFTLVLSNAQAFGGEIPTRYPAPFHVGFHTATPAQVDDIYRRLLAAGVPVPRAPGTIREGYGVYFTALNGILFEVAHLG